MCYLRLLLIFLLSFITFSFNSEPLYKHPDKLLLLEKQSGFSDPLFMQSPTPWADSVFENMGLDEKIGQLFNVAAYSNLGDEHRAELTELIEKYHIGGLTFFQGGPYRQAVLTNYYQSISDVPLMIAMDAEWGPSMRLDSTIVYPWQMTLGAIQDDEHIYKMGAHIAEQLKRLGVHVNFAPVIDVNNNPNNPVINARSFGENKKEVATKGIAYMRGLQDKGVLACAKHYPGHGDTDSDSHKTLPVISHSKSRIDSLELYPFRKLIKNGLGSIMAAHLYLPAFVDKPNTASSLSPELIDSLLKKEMGFNGLIFTDAMNMKGVSNYRKPAENDLKALQAGNDVLLLSQDVPKSIERIKQALEDSSLTMERINESVLKILKAKEWLGLNNLNPIELDSLMIDLHKPKYNVLNWKLTKSSITVLRNEDEIMPVSDLANLKIASLSIGSKEETEFQRYIDFYKKSDHFNVEKLPVSEQSKLMDTLMGYDLVLVGIHFSNKNPWVDYEISAEVKDFINILRLNKKTILSVFANAYSLQDFLASEHVDGLIMAYQNSEFAQQITAQVIFGGLGANGKLPIGVSDKFKSGSGMELKKGDAMMYGPPEIAGLSSLKLRKIDSIVMEGIDSHAFPGAQVLVARHGKIVFHKAYGKHKYEENRAVELTDLYDVASITKIASTLPSVMKLDGDGELDLDDELGDFLKITKGTEYEGLKLRAILAHQSGLTPWIPFYKTTLFHGMPKYTIYSAGKNELYPLRVAEGLYIIENYEDSIFNQIIYNTKVADLKEYKYSDIGYYFLKNIVEEEVGQPIDEYVQEAFYKPMGMDYTTFNPREKFPLTDIPPTEMDMTFRMQLIHGDVHDQGAAMLGGVGGHAGLFSNANSLAKLMQMYLNGGVFNGKRYLKENVVKEYTDCQFCKEEFPKSAKENRRAAGFDKPALRGEPGPTCDCVSYRSFGHSGFTGTLAWADPEEGIVYIFLSNRVYPSASNNKLVGMDIRTRIQQAIHDAIVPYNEQVSLK